jgi:hypothetical protein
MGTAEGINALLAGQLVVCKPPRLKELGVISLGPTNMVYHKVSVLSTSAEIIGAFGGEANAVTTDEEINILKEKQKNGEAGLLLTKCGGNIFFVRKYDLVRKYGALRVVLVYWYDDGWGVHEYAVDDDCSWSIGYQVFCALALLQHYHLV